MAKVQKFSFHNHTTRCMHAQPDMTDESLVKAHLEGGFTSMAFTDHCPWKSFVHASGKRTRMLYDQRQEYISSVRDLREKYAGKIRILLGYEMEYIPALQNEMLSLRQEADLIVLGQHYLVHPDSGIVQGFNYPEDHISSEDLKLYPRLIEQAARRGLPDIIGHPDIYMEHREQFGPAEEETAHRIAQIAVAYQLPLELNLARIAARMDGRVTREYYPDPDFWRIAAQYPVKVLYGLDCHWLFQVASFKASVTRAEEILGEKTLAALSFCTEDEIIRRRHSDV